MPLFDFCEVIFPKGPLGLRIYSLDGNPPVKIKGFYHDHSNDKKSKSAQVILKKDDVITRIGRVDVSKLSYEDVLRQIVKSKRPVRP